MSLPPGFLEELRTRTSLSAIVGKRVTWDMRKTNRNRGDWWAPCPFHQEKSPSFHVDDGKGFYYCFGCQAKGDAIGFLQETENASFMEAVEMLAREAGMAMPVRDPQAAARADRQTELAEVTEIAARHFTRALAGAGGAAARAYLEDRGLDAAACARWGIGFAPDLGQGLFKALTGQGIAPALVLAAGLAAEPRDRPGGAPYDVFRGRVMFPIRDARGRCIGFGGRAMAEDARAKYLNSPQSDLFDKGRSLFNVGPAREALRGSRADPVPLIVAEGYMDVIALGEAGFGAAVAPLGTAITETQLQMLWRMAPEPVVALDGDTAGLAAAMRLIDLALPLIGPGRSLRFAMLPPKTDPDDLIRGAGGGEAGRSAMQAVLDAAAPMVELLWRRLTEGQRFDTPERRAGLDAEIAALTGRIADASLRGHYREALRERRWDLFRRPKAVARGPAGPGRAGRAGGRPGRWAPPPVPAPGTKASALAGADAAAEERLREAVILAVVIRVPALLPRFEDALERLELSTPAHRALCAAALRVPAGADAAQAAEAVAGRAGRAALDALMGEPILAVIPALRVPGDTELAALCVAEELAKLETVRGLAREVAEASGEIDARGDERLTWRLAQAGAAMRLAQRPDLDDGEEFETAENGLKLNRAERGVFDALLAALPRKGGGG